LHEEWRKHRKKEKEKTVRKELGNLIKQGFVKKTHFEPVH